MLEAVEANDVNTRVTDGISGGQTALMLACAWDAPVSEIAALINDGADVNQEDFDGANALSHAAYGSRTNGSAIVRILLQRGANPAPRCHRPALLVAVDYNNCAAVRAMLEHGIDWKTSYDGKTTLTVASYRRRRESHAEVRGLLLAARDREQMAAEATQPRFRALPPSRPSASRAGR